MDVRVVTLNVWGVRGDWQARRDVLADGLRSLRPDLVALQETIVRDGYDQAADLLGPDYHVVHSRQREDDGQGVSIASRWPLGEVWEEDLNVTHRTADFVCTTLAAKVLAPDPAGTLLFVNHFPSYKLELEFERELQAVAAARLVSRAVRSDTPVVIAGDLDATPDAASIRFLTGKQSLSSMSICYRDAWESTHPDEPGLTHVPWNPLVSGDELREVGRRIDYVLVRCQRLAPCLGVAGCQLVFDEPVDGTWASDHFGVMADLVTPPPAP